MQYGLNAIWVKHRVPNLDRSRDKLVFYLMKPYPIQGTTNEAN